MAVLVIEPLEMVDIQQHDRRAVLRIVFQIFEDEQITGIAVVEIRQAVELHAPQQLDIGIMHIGHVTDQEQSEDAAVPFFEVAADLLLAGDPAEFAGEQELPEAAADPVFLDQRSCRQAIPDIAAALLVHTVRHQFKDLRIMP